MGMLVFDYDTDLPSLKRLIDLSNRAQWNVDDVDWTPELSRRGGEYEAVLEWHGIFRYDYIRSLPPQKTEALARQMVALDFSQILHGEQAALMLAGMLTGCVYDMDARIFAANQARDEARHVLAVRDLVKRIGPIYECGPILYENVENLLYCNLWPKQVLGLQLFLEARALLSFRQHLLFVKDPVFRDVITRIERDEANHVAFGVQYLKNGIDDLSEEDKKDLVDYAIWLDENVWHMIQHEQYRAAFEEVDLDYDACFSEQPSISFLNPHMGATAHHSTERMFGQFARWFQKALSRVGLDEAVKEQRALRDREQAMSPDDDIELKDEGEVADVLPWIKSYDATKKEIEAAQASSSSPNEKPSS